MSVRNGIFHTVTLFGSFGTLLCCALPALLTSIGAGAVMIGLVSAIPQLIWISEHKIPLFIFAGIMLVLSAMSRFLSRNAPCPVETRQAKACIKLRRISFVVFCFSLLAYAVGFYFAFIAVHFV